MKKILFLLICSLMMLSACENSDTVSQNSVSESVIQSSAESISRESDELWEKMNQAEEKATEFLKSDDYKNADKDKKVEMALKFVGELKNDGFIKSYDYSKDNELISYTHLNGVLGGISFHDFSEKIDGLAMN